MNLSRHVRKENTSPFKNSHWRYNRFEIDNLFYVYSIGEFTYIISQTIVFENKVWFLSIIILTPLNYYFMGM